MRERAVQRPVIKYAKAAITQGRNAIVTLHTVHRGQSWCSSSQHTLAVVPAIIILCGPEFELPTYYMGRRACHFQMVLEQPLLKANIYKMYTEYFTISFWEHHHSLCLFTLQLCKVMYFK